MDFVGLHRNEFQFLHRFRALFGGTRKRITSQIEEGFPYLPSGCHMEFDSVARAVVLENIRKSLPYTHKARANELRQVAESIGDINLSRFLAESGLELEDIYTGNYGWSDLMEAGGLPTLSAGPFEKILRKAIGRMLHVDDPLRVTYYRNWAQTLQPPDMAAMTLCEKRLFHMLVAILTESVNAEMPTLEDAANLLWKHPQVLNELSQVMTVLDSRIGHIQPKLEAYPDVPLSVHARYSQREILAAFANGQTVKLGDWREGVRWLPDTNLDLLAITLNKSSAHFSPTTRYRDYAINRQLFHWESQSTTRAQSPTGKRYQQHRSPHSGRAMPFVRLNAPDAFWLLGPAEYVSHQGERPMAITWHLDHAIPGDLFNQFAAAVT